ncbi:hypothetical protein SAMN05660313_01638 [Cellulophaga fucicola]|uniref:Uncharacterized protein n=1 Tax=Cellulophaga fucicola TaxID=76595 RepID=A0A1K1P5L3_9FLAO|nr:hypothetical protein SAMN05660313_01638 [Cellulophaga fucicola]
MLRWWHYTRKTCKKSNTNLDELKKELIAINNIEQDNYLGTEIDLTLGYKASKSITFNAGYSQMFATDTMEVIKSGDASKVNNWAWAMITFKPHFFSYTNN